MNQPYLSVVIPAYNEAKRLPLTLIDVDRHLSEQDFEYEIIVVNDGSKDSTAEIVERFSHIIKNLKLIDNKENHGKGAVVRQGMLAAQGKYRLFTDADNSTSIDQFSKMIPHLNAGYGVVFGSRAIAGSKLLPPQPFYRQIPGKMGNLFIQLLLLPGIRDTQCGFKCFTGEAADKVFSLAKIDRWGFDPEVLVLAKVLGYKIKEIPVSWVNNIFSKVGMGAYLQVLIEVIKIRWWLITGQYHLGSAKKGQ